MVVDVMATKMKIKPHKFSCQLNNPQNLVRVRYIIYVIKLDECQPYAYTQYTALSVIV